MVNLSISRDDIGVIVWSLHSLCYDKHIEACKAAEYGDLARAAKLRGDVVELEALVGRLFRSSWDAF
ncbi:hypothetical protein [Silvimonas soli]|uniref:hypothetical protein n=1 Tax=Silvimonas soli TaxID=2980100 RepID=UPI0024B360CF|nr:hypothetical protein [Silvimonas soli]